MTTAVVTGAAGFVGRHLTRALAEDHQRVVAIDVAPAPADFHHPCIEYNRLDICDTAALQDQLVTGATVYHLASRHLEVRAKAEEYEAVNVAAAERLTRACADTGVRRLIHTSTVGIYGHVAEPPADEDGPRDPQNIYEKTKLRGEARVSEGARELGLDTIILRPAWVYGPGCPRTAKLLKAVRTGRFLFVGRGRNLRHPIFITDLVEAFRRAASASGPLSRRDFIIAGPSWVTVRELIETAAGVVGKRPPRLSLPAPVFKALATAAELSFRVIGREPPVSRRTMAFFENDNAFDTTAAAEDLRFTATVDLAEGLATVARQSPTSKVGQT